MKQLYKWGGVIPSVFILLLSLYLPMSLFSCKSDDDDDSPTYYTITISSTIENGSVEASKKSASSGKSIKLTAKPATGYEFVSYSVTDSKGSEISVTNGEFKMPASSVTVSATFKETQASKNQKAADDVIAKINAIGTVAYTSDSKTKIDAAREAYNALTEAQQVLVTNYDTLTEAESTYESLITYTVTLTGGANATASGGTTTQSDLSGAMTTVTYTANDGYYFADFTATTTNGITLTRTSSSVVTVSGTPTTDTSITVPDAAQIVPLTAITLNKTATEIQFGSTETLSVTAVAPDNATDKTYTWKTSDESKATVDQDGKVTAVAVGTVTIYAEANDGSGVKGNCTVTVPTTITVTWNNDDITGSGNSFTKDGVTITAGGIDFEHKDFLEGGTFTTTLGNFTMIEVTTKFWMASGTGWSGSTWTGNASSVSFSGDIYGVGAGNTKFVFTIELKTAADNQAEEETGPTTILSGALVDGAIIKVNFKWHGNNYGDYVQGTYNAASGTFTVSKGGNYWGRETERAVYKVEKSGDNIIIGAGYYEYDMEGMVWTFNTTNDTYTTTNGDFVNDEPEEYGLISVTLNGTDITSQLTAQ